MTISECRGSTEQTLCPSASALSGAREGPWPHQSPAVHTAVTSQQQTELESGNNHVQSSIKVNAHLFEWKGAVSRKTVLKIHHLYFVSRLMFGKYHKSPAAWVLLHHCAPKAAGGFGAVDLREPISSPKLFPPAVADKASLFSLPLPLCLLWLLALITLCFYKFHTLLPFIFSSLTGMTLREWSLFSDSLKKEFLSWRWRLRANAEDNGASLPEKCVLFPYVSRQGFIALSSSASPCTASSSHTRTKQLIPLILFHLPSNGLLSSQVTNWSLQLHSAWGLARTNSSSKVTKGMIDKRGDRKLGKRLGWGGPGLQL